MASENKNVHCALHKLKIVDAKVNVRTREFHRKKNWVCKTGLCSKIFTQKPAEDTDGDTF